MLEGAEALLPCQVERFISYLPFIKSPKTNEIQTTPVGENADNWRQNKAGALVQEQRVQPFLYVTHHRQPFLLFDHR